MLQNDSNKSRLLTAAALAFLFGTRWMVYRLEQTNMLPVCFAAECALFLLLYALCMFSTPQAVRLAFLFFGCAALGGLYAVTETAYTADFLLPAAYFPVFLFYTDQSGDAAQKRSPALSKAVRGVMFFYHWFLLGLAVYTAVAKDVVFSARTVCRLTLAAALGAVYGLIARAPVKRRNKKQKQNKNDAAGQTPAAFVFAAFAVPVSCLYPAITDNTVAAETLLLLWAVNLPLLYAQGHPSVTAFAARLFKGRNRA